jgi:hypothetical protein
LRIDAFMKANADQPGEVEIVRQCGQCAHFCNAPAAMEAVFKGLSAMSSGYASVRAHDGLCHRHGVYLSYRDTCGDFTSGQHGDRLITAPSPLRAR